MKKQSFGRISSGEEATLFTITNANGVSMSVTDYGANLVSLLVPDKNGKPVDILLGYENAASYETDGGNLGATIGRVGNRIGGASFILNGITYRLDDNDNGRCLHGGFHGYHRRMWAWQADEAACSITFFLISPDGDQGFPGRLEISVTYSLDEENGLHILYHAVPDADTLINMTNHSYFNLNGHAFGSCLDHEAVIYGDFITESQEGVYPNGNIISVKNTPFDFTEPHTFAERIEEDHPQLKLAGGYDHNYVIRDYLGQLRPAAKVFAPHTGIEMEVITDLPGMQLYTGNFMDHFTGGKDGAVYEKRDGFCMETQGYPDAVHNTHFPTIICRKEEVYETETIYRFRTRA